jgi:hypothetical protein
MVAFTSFCTVFRLCIMNYSPVENRWGGGSENNSVVLTPQFLWVKRPGTAWLFPLSLTHKAAVKVSHGASVFSKAQASTLPRLWLLAQFTSLLLWG